jgi:hypothetical protein
MSKNDKKQKKKCLSEQLLLYRATKSSGGHQTEVSSERSSLLAPLPH